MKVNSLAMALEVVVGMVVKEEVHVTTVDVLKVALYMEMQISHVSLAVEVVTIFLGFLLLVVVL